MGWGSGRGCDGDMKGVIERGEDLDGKVVCERGAW